MTIDERVKRLEKQNRWFRAALLGLLIFCTVAAQKVASPAITAQGFTLVDPTGRKAASLAVTQDGPVLRMFDGNGNTRIALGMVKLNREYKPAIGFFDKNENLLGHVRFGRHVVYVDDPNFIWGLGDPSRLK